MNRKLAVSTVVALAFLTGCGTQQAGSRLEPAAQGSSSGKWAEVQRDGWPAAVPAEGLTKGLVLPIEKYLVPYTDEVVFLEGRSNAEIKCMRSLGFADWRTETIGDNPPVSGNSANMERRYGITIRSDAEQNGYHTPAEASGAAEVADIETPTAAIALAGKKDGKAVASFDGKALPEGAASGSRCARSPAPM